jgi:hypothetical protein
MYPEATAQIAIQTHRSGMVPVGTAIFGAAVLVEVMPMRLFGQGQEVTTITMELYTLSNNV